MSISIKRALALSSVISSLLLLSIGAHGKASSSACNDALLLAYSFDNNKPVAGRNRRRDVRSLPAKIYPKAQTDRLTVAPGSQKVRINVLVNDTGSGLKVSAVNPRSARGGRVFIHAGTVVYIPPAHFSGKDSFWYTVADNGGRRHSAKVIVCVCDK